MSVPASQKAVITAAAQKYGIEPKILYGIYGTETSFGKDVSTSSAGAVGPFQIEPGTAKSLGIDPYDFKQAAYGAARYLSQYKSRGVAGMLSAYNAGPAGGLQQGYVDTTLKNAAGFGSAPSVPVSTQAPTTKLPGLPTVPKEVESLDKPAYEQAEKASLVGKLLASEKGSEENPLLLSGLATTKAPLASEYETSKVVPVPQGQTVAEHNGNPIVKVTEGPKAGQTVYVPANVPNAKGGIGFTQAPDTTYNKGVLPEIASRANKLAVALGIKLTGLSGGRTPAHSVAVGGFADDPHTKNEASDTPGIEGVPKAILNKYGLERPFPGSKEADHIQLLHSVNKNGGY
jgi:transglycosylase-like protein with SLT domain